MDNDKESCKRKRGKFISEIATLLLHHLFCYNVYLANIQVEEKLILLYKKLDAANDELFFSVLKDTHQSVTKMKDEIPEQLRKLIRILTMKLDLKTDELQINNVILDNKKITELRNQPPVIRGKVTKKKYLTQDVAQKLLNSCNSISCKIINMLQLLADCKNVIKL